MSERLYQGDSPIILNRHHGFEEIREMEPSCDEYSYDYEIEDKEKHERAMMEQELITSVNYFKEKGESHRVLLLMAQLFAPDGVEISVFMTDLNKKQESQ